MTLNHLNLFSFLAVTCGLVLFSATLIAQKNTVTGIVRDTAEKKNLQYAVISLIDLRDSTLYKSVRSSEDGTFFFSTIPPGRYTIMVSYPRMADYLDDIIVKDTSKINLGKLAMVLQSALLEEVIVRASLPVRMKGDTLEYTADSFHVSQGSNVEALLKRLPGITVEKNGRIIAQGKEVKRVLVDGDEFFADDPNLVAKYLAAGSVDKVQVYDGKSEQAIFTGIDDGERTKTINLKLKEDKRDGYFGKLSAGSDGDKNYTADAMGAIFDKDMKVSVFGTGTRTGNIETEYDKLGKYVARDYEQIDDGAGSIYYMSNNDGDYDGYYGSGIPSAISGGAHFSNKWKNKTQKLFSNYRFKRINTEGWTNSIGYTIMPDGTSFLNIGSGTEESYSFSHKVSGSFTLPLDSARTTLQISVNGNKAENTSSNEYFSSSSNEKNILINNSNSRSGQSGKGGNFETNATIKHRFKQQGRSLVVALQHQYNNNTKDNINFSRNNYFDPNSGMMTGSDLLDQLQVTKSTMNSLAAKGSFVDKISDAWSYGIDYGFKRVDMDNLFTTFNKKDESYKDKVDSLSIDYNFLATTHIGGASLNWHRKKLNIVLGTRIFVTDFKQMNKTEMETSKRSFVNFSPSLTSNITLKSGRSLTFKYSGETQQPGVDQLQPLRRSSNPLYVMIGNPNLKPEFRSDINLNYSAYNWAKGRSFYVYSNFSFTNNAIGNSTITDANGRSISKNINLNGNNNYYTGGSYNLELKKLHLKPKIQFSVNGNTNYEYINNVKARNSSFNYSAGPGIGYNLADKLDLEYNMTVNYSTGISTIADTRNNNWSHLHKLNATWFLPKRLEFASDCSFSFQPKNKTFNNANNIVRWNASLQKKLFKGENTYIKLSVNDLLNNNTGYSRYVYGNSTSESNRLVVKRYFMLTITWNFSSL